MTLSVLSVLTGQSTLHFLETGDVGTSWFSSLCLTLWLASANNWVSANDTVTQLKLKLRRTSLLCCNFPCNYFVWIQKRERATTNKIKQELEQKQRENTVAELLLNESHPTAHVSFLARKRRWTAALNILRYSLYSFKYAYKYCNNTKIPHRVNWRLIATVFLERSHVQVSAQARFIIEEQRQKHVISPLHKKWSVSSCDHDNLRAIQTF